MRKRYLLAAAVVVVAACSDNEQTPTAPSSPSLATGENGLHGKPEPHVFLRRGFARPGGSVNLTYHGGPVLTASKAKPIFWGSSWNNASFAGDKITGINSFLQGFGGSNFAGTNTEYSGITRTMTALTSVIDASSEPPSRKALTTSQAVAEACSLTGNNPDPAALYIIYTSTDAGHVNYCAWHSAGNCGNGAPVQVAYMPNIDGIAGCDPGGPNLGHSQGLSALANVTAHELSEAITDPRLNAWYDGSGAENADKCAWVFPSQVTLSNHTTWQAQGNWSNAHYNAGTGYANLSGQKGCINGNQ